MQIPIQNIYYLLCYAWNKLEEKDRIKVSIDDKTDLLDLFVKVLINATHILLKRGLDKSYINSTEELTGVKGKIQISEMLKRNLLHKQKSICTFDDFSPNIISNRILVATIQTLIKTKGVDKQLRSELTRLVRMFPKIDSIEISLPLFRQVKIHRNNRFYGFILNVCQIIHESTFPSEEPGSYHFADFTRDDHKMRQLFEAFIRNFYKVEQNYYSVKRETIRWQFEDTNTYNSQFLPQMETDITLENENKKIIIDAKFYRETMTVNYDKMRIRSSHLYQLFSYLLNQQDNNEKSIKATGILLYPTIESDYDLDYKYNDHKILIRTVNLKSDWRSISNRLQFIVNTIN